MSTKAILSAVENQLSDAIERLQNSIPPHVLTTAQYGENEREFRRDLEEQARGARVQWVMKEGMEMYWEHKYEAVREARFWPELVELEILKLRIGNYQRDCV